ncbi:MAG: peptidyl-prolyl cis-trans isomerase [Candidatus Binatia bacterium]
MVFTDLRRKHVTPTSRSARPILLLIAGAAAGVLLAASGLVRAGFHAAASLPPGVVARVNGAVIRTEDYERSVAGLVSDRRGGVDGVQRRHVLDRLIEEELLVQRGLALGLARHDRKVRADLTGAVIASVVAGTQDLHPPDGALQAFYAQHRDFFTRVGRLRLRQVFCRAGTGGTPAAKARATEASRRLRAGEPFGAVRAALGDPEVSPLPDALLPPRKLMEYIGPTALHAALGLGVGEVSDPVRSGIGFHVLQVAERQPDHTPPLADIKPQVVAEFRRRAGDHALRSYLDDLRSRADVVTAATLP